MSNLVDFQVPIKFEYPPYNKQIFEEYFYKRFVPVGMIEYIPIFWTSMICERGLGGDYSDVQAYLKTLDVTKKYFTVVQHDDNILNDFGALDVTIFASGGYGKQRPRVYPIPLLCQSESDSICIYPKSLFASFVGFMQGRHWVRERMAAALKPLPNYYLSEPVSYQHFLHTMQRSTFSLCPRGYGQTSFRICESLQNDSIPVYIYDDPIFPFPDVLDFNSFGISIHVDEIQSLDQILSSKTSRQIEDYRQKGKEVYAKHFTYEGCYQSILTYLLT